jgi:hypothetical protein
MRRRVFLRRCRIEAPVEEVYRWHAQPEDPAIVESRSGGLEGALRHPLGRDR